MVTHDARVTARNYIRKGLCPVPMLAGSKNPGATGWQDLRLTEADVDNEVAEDSNIGIILGAPSRHIVDIDLDCPEAIMAARDLLPETRRFGRATAMDSHYLYFCKDAKTSKFQYKTMLVELRSTGTQTVFPGSIHGKTGEAITWVNKETPVAEIAEDALKTCVGKVAAVSLLARELSTWSSGRHDIYMALTGALLRGCIPADEVRQLLRCVVDASGDPEPQDRGRVIDDTIEHYNEGGEVRGWPTLADEFDSALLKKLKKWLPIDEHVGLKVNGQPAAVAGIAGSSPAQARKDTPATPATPEPLLREIEAGEDYPVEALGDVLAPMASAMHDIIKAPAGLCAQSVLGSAALVAQAHADVVMDDFRYPLSLFLLSIALTGERKTTADNAAMKPINDWQLESKDSHHLEQAQYHAELAAWQAVHEGGMKAAAEGEGEEAARILIAAGPEPTPPASPIMLMHEPTYEGIVRHLEVNWPSAGLYSDEGGRFLGGYAMATTNMLHTAAGLSEVWDGKPISRVRAQETKLLFGRRVSMHLMAQPGVATIMMGSDELADQGLLSRILVTHPGTLIGSRTLTDMNLSAMPAAANYYAAINALLDRTPTVSDSDPHQLLPAALKIDGAARTRLRKFYAHTEPLQAPGQYLAPIAGLASKSMQQCMRIAGVLTLVSDPGAGKVTEHAIDAAIILIEHYLGEALRLRSISKGAPDLVAAQKLLDWAHRLPADVVVDDVEMRAVHAKQIYQYGPDAIRDKATALHLAEVLEGHGWFVRLPQGTRIDKTARKLAWQVIGEGK